MFRETHRHRLHCFFFFNDTATTEIYTLSLHDALPISEALRPIFAEACHEIREIEARIKQRSEEHTSELQSRPHLVCRLLLEKIKLPYQSSARQASARRLLPSPSVIACGARAFTSSSSA